MLSKRDKELLAAAFAAQGDSAHAMVPPLSGLAGSGTDVSIDFSTTKTLGAPVIIARPRPRSVLDGLTPRQQEVALLVAEGLRNKDIARQLALSPATIKDHVHAILQRLGVQTRSEICALVHRVTD